MRNPRIAGAALVLLLGCPAALAADAPTVDPRAVLDHVDDLFRGEQSHGSMTMRVVTAHFTRELTIEEWSEGKDRFLARIGSPAREKGTATLRIGPDVWNYLPGVDRVIKVPSSLMSGAWMGSHVSNDDLVKMSRMSSDYDAKVTFDGEREGRKLLELTLVPKPDAAVVWGKVVVAVERETLLPVEIRDYDEAGTLARTTAFSDVKKMGGRTLPAVMTVTPADKPGESTRVEWTALDFAPRLGKDFFSLRNLKG